MSAIEVRELGKTYRAGAARVEALRGISFAVEPGEVFALLGPNGAGKSTTVRILTTLSVPSRGTARVAGLDVLAAPRAVRQKIGYVAQASGVDIYATGRENLELQGRFFRLASAALQERARELLAIFGLDEAADRLVKTYSGGMKRRLDVAMGLIHRPEILFLDEPTTGLDPESRAKMWEEVFRLARGGLTILLTTHYLEEADRLAQRIAIVDQGRIVAEGSPEELKRGLRGDVVTIELGGGDPMQAEGILGALPGVTGVTVDGRTLVVQVADGARAIPTLVGALERSSVEVAQVAASRPSLDDVYLTLTGHSFADGHAVGGGDKGQAVAGR